MKITIPIILLFLIILSSCTTTTTSSKLEKEEMNFEQLDKLIYKIEHITPCNNINFSENKEKVIFCRIMINSTGGDVIQEVYLPKKYYVNKLNFIYWNETIKDKK